MTGLLASFIATQSLAAGEPIVLRKGDIEIRGCMRRARLDLKVCHWGMQEQAGCAGECGEAALPEDATFRLGCGLRASGVIVDPQDGRPRPAFPVDFIVAGRSRYRGRTGPDGRFLIEVPADMGASKCRERREFGRMSVESDTPKVILLGSLSRRFRSRHPELKLGFKKAAELAPEGVDINP